MTRTQSDDMMDLAARLGSGQSFESAAKAATGITIRKPRPGGNLFIDFEMKQDDMPYPVSTTWWVKLYPGDDPVFTLVEWNPEFEVLEGEQPPATNPTTDEVYEAVLEAAQDQWKEQSQ